MGAESLGQWVSKIFFSISWDGTIIPKKATTATSVGPSSVGTVARASLFGLPIELQLCIVEFLDPFSKICLQRGSSYFFRIIEFKLIEFLSNEKISRRHCAQYALLAVLEQDGQPRQLGWWNIDQRRYGCARRKEFHPKSVFDPWSGKLDRNPRERSCSIYQAPRYQTGTQNEWTVERLQLCMHCGFEKEGGFRLCRCTCPYCLLAVHDRFTRFHTVDLPRVLYYWFERCRGNHLIVQEVKMPLRLTKRDMIFMEEHPGADLSYMKLERRPDFTSRRRLRLEGDAPGFYQECGMD